MSNEKFTEEDLIAEEPKMKKKTSARSNQREIDLSSPEQETTDEPFIDPSKVHPEILQKFLDDYRLKKEDLPYLHSMEDVINLFNIRVAKELDEEEDPFSERTMGIINSYHL